MRLIFEIGLNSEYAPLIKILRSLIKMKTIIDVDFVNNTLLREISPLLQEKEMKTIKSMLLDSNPQTISRDNYEGLLSKYRKLISETPEYQSSSIKQTKTDRIIKNKLETYSKQTTGKKNFQTKNFYEYFEE